MGEIPDTVFPVVVFDLDGTLLRGTTVSLLLAEWVGQAAEIDLEGESCLRARGTVRLTAIVAEDDPAAIAFWDAAGYQRQPQRARFIRNDSGSKRARRRVGQVG